MSNFQQFEVLSETEVTAINGGGILDIVGNAVDTAFGAVETLANAVPPVITNPDKLINEFKKFVVKGYASTVLGF